MYFRNIVTNEQFNIEFSETDTWGDIKKKIAVQEGIPVAVQNIFLNGQKMPDEDIVANYNHEIQTTAHIIFLLNINQVGNVPDNLSSDEFHILWTLELLHDDAPTFPTLSTDIYATQDFAVAQTAFYRSLERVQFTGYRTCLSAIATRKDKLAVLGEVDDAGMSHYVLRDRDSYGIQYYNLCVGMYTNGGKFRVANPPVSDHDLYRQLNEQLCEMFSRQPTYVSNADVHALISCLTQAHDRYKKPGTRSQSSTSKGLACQGTGIFFKDLLLRGEDGKKRCEQFHADIHNQQNDPVKILNVVLDLVTKKEGHWDSGALKYKVIDSLATQFADTAASTRARCQPSGKKAGDPLFTEAGAVAFVNQLRERFNWGVAPVDTSFEAVDLTKKMRY